MAHIRNATADVPDTRDHVYEPALVPLPRRIAPVVDPAAVLDQKAEGACTGFALAAAIGRLAGRAGRADRPSARMLYEMAKRSDEWPGEAYEGTSLRGAIRGWKNHGVCSATAWPYASGRAGHLTVARAKEARRMTIGAYYRVRPVVSDVHAALVEAGVVVMSALVHAGWDTPRRVIRRRRETDGAHAFAVVGYDDRGFWIQNSWGAAWGTGGTALWTYEDWAENVMDTWVLRLALPTPQIFGIEPRAALVPDVDEERASRPRVPRMEIAGHFVHIDDGQFAAQGKYWSDADDVRETATLVAESEKYDHLLFYAHGGLNTPADAARRIRAFRDGFKRNRIYPYHFMYDTGLVEELTDILQCEGRACRRRVGGLSSIWDRFLEGLVRRPGGAVWTEMKRDAKRAFRARAAGTKSVELFLDALEEPGARPKAVHLVGHSTGGVLIAHLLHALRDRDAQIASCTLLAPACTLELYEARYVPALRGGTTLGLRDVEVLNLSDGLELDDEVATVYRKSLLYLVSNAFESDFETPLLGLERFQGQVDPVGGKTRFRISDGLSGRTTRSRTHGGFDEDLTTMNHVLRRILGTPATRPFETGELTY